MTKFQFWRLYYAKTWIKSIYFFLLHHYQVNFLKKNLQCHTIEFNRKILVVITIIPEFLNLTSKELNP